MNDGGLSISLNYQPSSDVTGPYTPTKILQEAFELQSFQINNSTLLDYGLHTGLISRSSNGQMIMSLLNIKLMSGGDVVKSVLMELFLRLGIFVSATSLIKMAIDSDTQDPDVEDVIRGIYILSVLFHQSINFNSTNLRNINRLLMSVAILLFNITTPNSPPCENMKNFKHKIRKRLTFDYYLWCLLFAMDLVLTWSSPLHIDLEQAYGTELNISHIMLSSYCVIHLSRSMQMIGHGRLTPLIIGTPLLFLDAGDSVSAVKALALVLYYLCFWCSDWRELVDWNHLLLCEAGVCSVLSSEQGNLKQIRSRAKTKFDDWLIEHGLDDEGWFIVFDSPSHVRNGTIIDENESSDTNQNESEPEIETEETEPPEGSNDEQNENNPTFRSTSDHESDSNNQPRDSNISGRVIYLPSRHPLLTTLAAILIIVWK